MSTIMPLNSDLSTFMSPFLMEHRTAQPLEKHNLLTSIESHKTASCATLFVVEDRHTGLITINVIIETDIHLIQDTIRQCGMEIHKLYLHPTSQHVLELESILRDLLQPFKYIASTCCCNSIDCEKFEIPLRHAVIMLQMVDNRIELHEVWKQLPGVCTPKAQTYSSEKSSLSSDIYQMSSRYTPATGSSSLRPWTENFQPTPIQYVDIPILPIEEALQQVGSGFEPDSDSDSAVWNEMSMFEPLSEMTEHFGEDCCYSSHAMLDDDFVSSAPTIRYLTMSSM